MSPEEFEQFLASQPKVSHPDSPWKKMLMPAFVPGQSAGATVPPPAGPSPLDRMPAARPAAKPGFDDDELYKSLMEDAESEGDRLAGLADEAEKLETHTDLSPLMALSDSWTGGGLSKGYQKPLTAPDKLKLVSELRKRSQEAKTSTAGTQLRKLIGEGNLDARSAAALLAAARAGSKDQDRDLKTELLHNKAIYQVFKDLNQSKKLLDKEELALNQSGSLIEKSKDGNTVAFSALGTKMARAMGEVGVLTEEDVRRYVNSGQLSRKIGDRLSSLFQGKATDATLDEVKEITQFLQYHLVNKERYLELKHARVAAETYDVPIEDIYRKLDIIPPDETELQYNLNVRKKRVGKASGQAAAGGGGAKVITAEQLERSKETGEYEKIKQLIDSGKLKLEGK